MGQTLKPGKSGGWRLRGRALCTASVIPFLVLSASRGLAQPVGASVVAGQAQVSSSGTSTVINQATSKAIINWQDFSVAAGASVQFNQPNAASIALNRVTGASTSNIDGAIRANGQVWLLNPNGVMFGANARINVGGLLATTSDLANQDFNEGRYNFTGGRNSIVNNGEIKTSGGGSVVLSAPKVVNNGLIQANAGHVVLGGTDTFTVDFDGDRLLSYAVGNNSAGGTVTNTGKISAPGGRVLMTARAASGVQEAVINNSGMAEATSVHEENGEIVLEAEGGSVANSGTLDASGKGAGETGGTIKVLGKQIALADDATIDVSGDAGGGTALIGGNFHGQGSEQHAQTTTIAKASIKADAITKGNGGKVAVWSDGRTDVSASITARGGASGGDGGQVETSGHDLNITSSAFVSTLAPAGKSGTWLLDPDNIIIVNGGCTAIPGSCPDLSFGSSGTASVDPAAIVNALNAGNVLLQANTDITVTTAVVASSSNTLEMEAGRSIVLNAGLQNTGGSIGLYAGNPNATGGTQSGATISGSGVVSASNMQFSLGAATGSIGSLGSPILVNAASGDLQLSVQSLGADAYIASAGGISASRIVIANITTPQMPGINNHQGVNLESGSFTLSSSVQIAQGWGITANNLDVSTLGNSPISLGDIGFPAIGDVGNVVSGTARFTTANGGVTYGNGNSSGTTLGSSTITGGFTVTAAALGPVFSPSPTTTYYPLTLSGAISASGSVSLEAGSIIQSGGSIAAPTISLTGHGGGIGSSVSAITVSNPGGLSLAVSNTGSSGDVYITSSDAVTVTSGALSGGVFDLQTAGDLTVTGAITTSTNYIYLSSFGSLNLNANITDTGGTLFLLANAQAAPASAATINGTGTLSAANVAIQLYGDAAGTGTIGTAANPLQVTSGNATLQLEVSTGSQSAYLKALKAVNLSSIDSILSITRTELSDGLGVFGDFIMTAAGQVTQSAAVAARALTVLSPFAGINLSHAQNAIQSTVTLGAMETGRGSTGTIVFKNSVDTQLGKIGGVDTSGNFQPGAAPLAAQAITITGAQFAGGPAPRVTANDYVVSGGLTSIAADDGIFVNFPALSFPIVGDSVRLNGGGNAVGFDGGTVEVQANSVSVTSGVINDIYLAVKPLSGSSVDISGGLGGIGLDAGPPGANQGSVYLDYYDGSLTESGAIRSANLTVTGNCSGGGCGPLDVTLTGANRISGIVSVSPFGAGDFSLVNTMDLTLGSMTVGGTINVQTNDVNQFSSPTFNSLDPHAFIAINGVIQAGDGNSVLHASGDIHNANPGGDQIAVDGLSLISDFDGIGSSTGRIDLIISALQAKTSGSDIWLSTSGSFNIFDAGAGVSGLDTGAGSVNITANGLTQSAAITAGNFTLNLPAGITTGAPVTLTDVNNAISGNIIINAKGGAPTDTTPTVALANSRTMNVNAINISSNAGSSTVGNVSLRTVAGDIDFKGAVNGGYILAVSGGNLIVDNGVVLTATGTRSTTAILLSANGNFINNAGPSVFSLPGSGNWQIYSASPANDVFGNLNSQNYAIYNTTYPTPVSAAGNRYIFAYQPSVTISANAASKIYGVDNSAALSSGYSISANSAIAAPNAYLTDTTASFSGMPSITSTGSAAGAGVGLYAISVGAGTFAANGYAVIFQNNLLTVLPATLSYVANAASRAFGAANPVFSGNVAGFVNGDSLASATSGTLVFTSRAGAADGVGSYAINGSGLSAANYVFVQAPGNATALTITAAVPTETGGLDDIGLDDIKSIITGFTASMKPPLGNPALGDEQGAGDTPPVAPPSSPPSPPPPGGTPLADNNITEDGQPAEAPISSDQATDDMVASLEGAPGDSGAPIIPGLLDGAGAPPPPPLDASALPGFGNSALWQ